jgi:ribosome-binding ATPase
MKIGIIGLPGSGKTTLFRLLTESFEGEPAHVGQKPRMKTVKVVDPRLVRLRDDYQPKKFTPASIEVHDFPAVRVEGQDRSGIADLLAPAREMEALLVVVRSFEAVGMPPPGPPADLNEILGELILSDLVIVERRLERLEAQLKKHIQKTHEDDRREKELLLRVKTHLEAENDLTGFAFTAEERKRVGSYQFLSAKPRVLVLNRGETPPGAAALASLAAAAAAGAEPIVLAAQSELEVLQLPPEERGPFLEEFGIGEPSRERVIAASYRAAGRIAFFTAGDKEVRAWTIREGETAVEAAGEIHSDIQRGFIRAELVAYEDYRRDGGIKGAKEKGHFRLEGKEYVVADGDIIEFRFSV